MIPPDLHHRIANVMPLSHGILQLRLAPMKEPKECRGVPPCQFQKSQDGLKRHAIQVWMQPAQQSKKVIRIERRLCSATSCDGRGKLSLRRAFYECTHVQAGITFFRKKRFAANSIEIPTDRVEVHHR